MSSWVLTYDELQALQGDQGYQAFVRSVLMTHTVAFVGISVDDTAVGGHLDFLAKAGIDLGPHLYWFTDRSDAQTDKFAEEPRATRHTVCQ